MNPENSLDGGTRHVDDMASAYLKTLEDILNKGKDIAAGESLSVGSGKKSKEIRNYSLLISKPKNRLPLHPLNLPGAVARFVWMMAANDRLKDIEFYWGAKVTPFSDDGILLQGSSYGQRMLHPRPGLNQVENIVNRLKADPNTRRAAIAIYQAEDASRDSKDIPCAFGLFYHIRDGALHATVIMRSNNAFTLLPYNMFEFSLLAEAIAAELKVSFGTLSYYALSMHIFEDHYTQAQSLLQQPQNPGIPFDPIPSDPSPIEQIKQLVKLEAECRHAAAGFNRDNFDEWLDRGATLLNSYWQQLYFLLLLHMAKLKQLQPAVDRLNKVIISPWKESLPEGAFTTQKKTAASAGLFPDAIPRITITPNADVFRSRLLSLDSHCTKASKRFVTGGAPPLNFEEYQSLRNRLVGDPSQPLAEAARHLDPQISDGEFSEALRNLRK